MSDPDDFDESPYTLTVTMTVPDRPKVALTMSWSQEQTVDHLQETSGHMAVYVDGIIKGYDKEKTDE